MVKLRPAKAMGAECFRLTDDPITPDNIGEVVMRLSFPDGDHCWYRASRQGWECPLPRVSVEELDAAYAVLHAMEG